MKLLTASRLRRLIQIFCLGLFLYLLGWAGRPASGEFPPPDFFLRLDPLAALAVPLAAREFVGRLVAGLAIILAALILGRVFCGYICPFGFTLDLVTALKQKIRGRKAAEAAGPLAPLWRRPKYCLLAAVLSAALAGISLIFWVSPIPLITRFYALLIYPLFLGAADSILAQGTPLFESLGWTAATYASIKTRAFDSLGFLLVFFGAVFWLEWKRPRFWCQALCPAGALLGLAARRPLWRRRVSDRCIHCGRCHRRCPAGTISPDGLAAGYSECLTCQNCVRVCPVGAVKFGFGPEKPAAAKGAGSAIVNFQPLSRRAFIGSAAAGLGLAWFQSSGLSAAMRLAGSDPWPAAAPVRPPGSRSETRFLALCLRCGECIKACPTNGLAPAGLKAGPGGWFSPYLLARRGPCEPECNLCGQVCPTGAIVHLPLAEKRWAKMGTARILKETCLAWAEDRRCVVCQEVCPYGAINLRREPGLTVPAPLVRGSRCNGCGYCEHHCPADPSAIVVESKADLHLGRGYYRLRKRYGPGPGAEPRNLNQGESQPEDQPPPGFLELD